MSTNTNLHSAKKAKNDEFYTQYEDIAKELPYYKEQLAGKIVYCNCDNPLYSNFYKFFKDKFEEYKLKSVVATHIGLYEYYSYKPMKYTFDGHKEIIEELQGSGDFRSYECIGILQSADIVITNPPFSLFREFVGQLFEYDKKFIILGNMNAITYKEIFPLIKDNKIWLGYSGHSGKRVFLVPDDEKGNKYTCINNIRWFTNIDTSNRHKDLILTKKYNSNEYPKYDNYNAINIDKIADIPYDYDGIMGVPITFLDKYNPEQFEIIRFRKGTDGKDLSINGKDVYFRILIKRK